MTSSVFNGTGNAQTAASFLTAAVSSRQDQKTTGLGKAGDYLLNTAKEGPFDELSDELVKTLKDGVEVAGSLKEALNSAKNSQRGEKISKLKEKIEQLKERLKYATPEQAKQLARELKQLGKEFKQAAQSLSGTGTGTAGLTAGTSVQAVGATATEAAAGAVGPAVAQPAIASGGIPVEGSPLPGGSGPSAVAAEIAGVAAQTQAVTPGAEGAEAGQPHQQPDGKEAESTAPGAAASPSSEFQTAAEAYGNVQESTQDQASGSGDAAQKQSQYEELRKIQQDLKALAARIKALAKRDDKEAKKELEKAEDELREGNQALEQYQSQQLSLAGSAQTADAGRSVAGNPVAQSVEAAPVSVQTVTIPANLPINVIA